MLLVRGDNTKIRTSIHRVAVPSRWFTGSRRFSSKIENREDKKESYEKAMKNTARNSRSSVVIWKSLWKKKM